MSVTWRAACRRVLTLTFCAVLILSACGGVEQEEECGADSSCAAIERAQVYPMLGKSLKKARERLSFFELDVQTVDGSPTVATAKILEQVPRSGNRLTNTVIHLTIEGSNL